jgi:two-component system, cell cycle sensor histidine kinase and response regulator CckA
VEALRREIDHMRGEAEALRDIADRVPDLEAELKKSRQEKRRQFERAPYGLCRCSANGTIIEANHSFVALLGYRRAEDVRELSWLTVTRERTGDLGWLLERARATRKAEAVETQWNTREGRSVIVRLQALVTSEGAIDIVAEDITTLRALEGQLRQAQKMEAVGRLASEVAVTCDAVLGDVDREAREWIDRLESIDLRISAQRMMEEVTRARGFLRRLGIYGDEQKRALEPVSVKHVLRDLAPVLRRLVGERISLELPKSAGLFPVDVDAERLERVLTNVAGYARERMPMGGQVKIDLATIAIGRRFAAGHSNVRAGDHVLITVTELPSAGSRHTDVLSPARRPDTVGMELGVLVELISSCGGHLWLEAQPAGNMLLKIHLPRLAIKENRGGRLSQWLRAASVANIVT